MMNSIPVSLLLVSVAAAAAADDEMARYRGVLDTCYAEAATPEALTDCIGLMAEACMNGEEGGQTTLGITGCSMAETRAWDTYLNREYRETMSALEVLDAEAAEYFPEFANRVEKLRDARRAWIGFRDAECGLAYAMWGSGSMRNIAASGCNLDMTAKRIIELRELRSEMR